MEDFPKSLEGVLKKSIELEEKGYAFYLESAGKVKNSVGKRIFETLGNDEQHHIERIKDMFAAIQNETTDGFELADVEIVSFESIFDRMKDQMSDSLDELSETGVDDEEVIDIALELEKHSHLFYEKAAGFAEDEKVKAFYKMLAEEEKTHYEVLNKTRSFLEDPSLFFGAGGAY